jgi:pyridinium-3,5-biscarboxylic acid mononucleotide synthase
MNDDQIRELIEAIASGAPHRDASPASGYVDIGAAKVDLDRERRRGTPEVIFCDGKTPEQIAAIAAALVAGAGLAFGTRCAAALAERTLELYPGGAYDPVARTIRYGEPRPRFTTVTTAVIAAGTSDRPVAEEACATLETFGAPVDRIYDVGVAGLHRLLDQREKIESAGVLIVIAGMEGALPSVIGGLARQPLIAVPTSIGYGTALGGFTALFGMLTSCASGISVVNIDNGFGAAMAAISILRAIESARSGSQAGSA